MSLEPKGFLYQACYSCINIRLREIGGEKERERGGREKKERKKKKGLRKP